MISNKFEIQILNPQKNGELLAPFRFDNNEILQLETAWIILNNWEKHVLSNSWYMILNIMMIVREMIQRSLFSDFEFKSIYLSRLILINNS